MRTTLLLALLSCVPAMAAQAEPRFNRLPPASGCAAPALLPAALPRPVQADDMAPRLRRALLACPAAPKRPLRWT